MTTWAINNQTFSALGLTLVAGNFQVQGVSKLTLERAVAFDELPGFSFGDSVVIYRDGQPFFQGRVASIPKHASGTDEGQTLEIADAWDELDKTIYQEEWATGTTSVFQPRAVLGLGKISGTWTNLTVAQQIQKVLEYAISQGVELQVGSIPTGERLLPTEVSNISCAEAMQMALKFHPDWIPWIDHSTLPPTLHVTPIGSATGASFAVDGSSDVADFQVVERADLLPQSVRIIYESADEIAGDVYRKCYVDKYPTTGPDGGPQVLTATIPLEGMKAQIQKSRLECRTLPATQATAKAWIKAKFPQVAGISDANMRVSVWSLELVTEDDADFPPPVSPQATRMALTDISQATHELVRGSMEDWMRRRAGPVRVYFKITCDATVSEDLRLVCESLPTAVIITGTNAVTKTYKNISHWSAPADIPTGIAQSVYNALHASMPYQGSVTITAQELPAVPYHGRVISLPPAWPTMNAPVHSVDWDVNSGRMRLGFGPAKHLAPADFLEMQRILRARPVTWWSFDERDSGMLGYEAGPSAQGDTVAGFEQPRHEPEFKPLSPVQFQIYNIHKNESAGTWKCKVKSGYVLAINPEPGTVMNYVSAGADQTFLITASTKIYCKVLTTKKDLVSSATLEATTAAVTDIHAQPDPGGNTGVYYYLLAEFETVGSELVLKTQYHAGGPISHRPSRNNRNLKITIKHYKETSGVLGANGSDTYLFFRQGLYVGTTDPADGATQDTVTITESLPTS